MDTRTIAKEYRLQHWTGILQERIASGTSIRAYCQTAGISENTYYYWQRKLREAACQEMLSAATSKEVVPHGWAVCEGKPSAVENMVTVEIGKFRVRVGAEVSAAQLEQVCQVLMKLC